MKLTKLQLENFRNYQEYDFEFTDNCTILVGENGKGKTNFLEAIYVLSLGRTFRHSAQDCMIEWESHFLRCKCQIQQQDQDLELEVFYTNTPRRYKNLKKNGVNLRSSQYIGSLLTVLFHPEDLNLLYLSPSLRRKYLDSILSQTDKEYLQALSDYKKVLRQRNSLLQKLKQAHFSNNPTQNTEDLETWNQKLIEFGSIITKKRIAILEFLSEIVQPIYQKISRNKEKISIHYKSKFLDENQAPDQLTEEFLKEQFQNALKQREQLDILRGITSIGPHRDDIDFKINQKNITESASRGEFRTLLLALKIAEIDFIKEKTDQRPILLLDDVFSELDQNRQKHLLEAISDCQTIITTTNLQGLEKISQNSKVINIG